MKAWCYQNKRRVSCEKKKKMNEKQKKKVRKNIHFEQTPHNTYIKVCLPFLLFGLALLFALLFALLLFVIKAAVV